MALSFGSVIYYSYIYNSLKHSVTMEVTLTPQEAEEHFFNALCNGADYLGGYGLSLDYSDEIADKARKTLKGGDESKSLCREDVWMQILREGGTLDFIDEECDGEYNVKVTLAMVHENVAKTPLRHLMDAINENDDATTADCILQSVMYEDVIFG